MQGVVWDIAGQCVDFDSNLQKMACIYLLGGLFTLRFKYESAILGALCLSIR